MHAILRKVLLLLAVALFQLIDAQSNAVNDEVGLSSDVCLLPKQPGNCRAAFVRWFYNKDTKKCQRFIYGGCAGNENNFQTLEDCEKLCLHVNDTEASDAQSSDKFDASLPFLGPCHIAQRRFVSGKFIAQCTGKGFYSLIQCHGATGNCWCVHPKTGQEVISTRVPPGTVVHCPKCHAELAEALKSGVLQGPQCNNDGFYSTLQCNSKINQCWCVHPQTGIEIESTRSSADNAPANCPTLQELLSSTVIPVAAKQPLGPCQREYVNITSTGLLIGARLPQCTEGGFFDVRQCHGSTGYCWCVDPEFGREIPGTRRSPTNMQDFGCGACHLKKSESYQTGPPPLGAFIPQCDNYGNFLTVQCHGSAGSCWCVDAMGKELPDSRVGRGQFPDCTEAIAIANNNGLQPSPPSAMPPTSPPTSTAPHTTTTTTEKGSFVTTRPTRPTTTRQPRPTPPPRPTTSKPVATRAPVTTPRPAATTSAREITSTQSLFVFFNESQTQTPLSGPCSKKLLDSQKRPLIGGFRPRCMKSGYYELVQCHPSTGYCWCADVTSGAEIANTRIGPGQGSPICSICHVKKAETYLNGVPAIGAFVPQCHDSGFFEPLQCHGSSGFCWCVDPISGEELQGTRIGPGAGAPPTCPLPATTEITRLDIPIPTDSSDPLLGPRPDAPVVLSGPCKQGNQGKGRVPGRSVARCTDSGFYTLVQCSGSSGQCWCVDPERGTEIIGTRRKGGLSFSCPECLQRKSDAFLRGAPPPGAFVYSCDNSGEYTSMQCHGSSGHCWCVNKTSGQEILGTRARPREDQPNCDVITEALPPKELSVCQSQRARALAQGLLGAFAPTCDKNGDFHSVQCHGSTGICWCVNGTSGIEVINSRKPVNKGPPDCSPGANLEPTTTTSTTTRPPQPTVNIETRLCLIQRKEALSSGRVGSFVPSCDTQGKFAPMQCHGSTGQCYCVHVESGAEVPGSRVPAQEQLQCAECKNLFDLISDGQIGDPLMLPQCDSFGDFIPLQCNSTIKECWCVTPDAGVVIGGTRRPISVKEPLCLTRAELLASRDEALRNSDSIPPAAPLPDALVDKSPVQTQNEEKIRLTPGPVTPPKTEGRIPLAPGPVIPTYDMFCKDSKKVVGDCNEKLLRWYFDDEHQECLAFTFSGCGGNLNNFETYLDCISRCKIPDGQPCSGDRGPYIEPESGQLRVCHGPSGDKTCPTGYSCRMGAFFGSCCHEETEALYLRNYRPTCKNGGGASTIDAGGFQQALLGLTCEDNFCPESTSCEQGEIFAWCCEGKPLKIEFANEPQKSKLSVLPDMEVEIVGNTVTSNLMPACATPKDAGRCRGRFPKWYFDPEHFECLAFNYGGCGGNQNRFDTKGDCEISCKHADAPLCAGNAPAYFDERKNATLTCESPSQCPKGYICRFGAFFGSCCDSAKEELYQKNYSPTCPGVMKLVEREFIRSFREPLLGKSCRDGFCPQGTTCHQGDIFAFCCRDTNHGCITSPKGSSCSEIQCPSGYSCNQNEFICCNSTLAIEISSAMGTNYCSDSSSTAWLSEEDTLPILGASCSDLLCPDKYRCEQATSSFARCCSGKPDRVTAEDDPAALDIEHLLPPAAPNCTAPKDPGTPCEKEGKAAARWYYNGETRICTSFAYYGCGGNGNVFATQKDCIETCIPLDGPACYAGKPAYQPEDGRSLDARSCSQLECPDGWKCSMGFVGAVCCNATHEELFEDAYNKTCSNGHEAFRRFNGQYHEHYLGDSCEDLICPENYECHQVNNLFAKCCSVNTVIDHPKPKCPIGEPTMNNGSITFCTDSFECQIPAFCHKTSDETYGICCPVPKLPSFLLDVLNKQNCTQEQESIYEQCLVPFTQRPDKFSPLNLDRVNIGILPTGNKISLLNETCSLYNDYIKCTSTLISNSNSCFFYGNHVLREIIGYACSDSSQSTIKRNNGCLEEVSNSSELTACEAEFNRTFDDSAKQGFSEGFSAVCESIRNVANCSIPIFHQKCSSDLGEFMQELLDRTKKSLFGGKCSDDQPLLLPLLPGGIQGPGPVIIPEIQQDPSDAVLDPVGPPVAIPFDFPPAEPAKEASPFQQPQPVLSANDVIESIPPGLRNLGPGPVILPNFAGCTADESMRFRICLYNLRNGSSAFGELLSGNGSSVIISEQLLAALPNVCDSYKQFTECLVPLKSSATCLPPARAIIDGILGFSCQSSNLEKWQGHGECFGQLMNKTETKACVADAESELQAAIVSRRFEGACGVMDGFLACMRETVVADCGVEGSQFYHDIYTQLGRVLLGSCLQTCKQFREAMIANGAPPIGSNIPQCQPNGKFKPVQCSGSTGYCWCVNVDTGTETADTRSPPGKTPECGDSVPSCPPTMEQEKRACRSIMHKPLLFFYSVLVNDTDPNIPIEFLGLGALPEFATSLYSTCQQFFSCRAHMPEACLGRELRQLEPAYAFFCSVGIPQLIQSFTCLYNFQSRPEFQKCFDVEHGFIKGRPEEFFHDCKAMKSTMSCMHMAVKKQCSNVTWQNFRVIHEKFIGALNPSCDLFSFANNGQNLSRIASHSTCSPDVLEKEKMCHAPYFSILNPVTILEDPLKTREICRVYTAFPSCLNSPQCSLVGKALAEVMNELCYGSETIMENSKICLKKIDNRHVCHSEQRHVSTTVLYSNNTKLICEQLVSLKTCATTVVYDACGPRAAVMLNHMHQKFKDNLVPKCPNEERVVHSPPKIFSLKTREPIHIDCPDGDWVSAVLCYKKLGPHLQPIVGLKDPLKIQDACLAYHDFRECSSEQHSCLPQLRRGTNQVFQYICSDGRSAYEEVAPCLKELGEKEDMQYCAIPYGSVELFTARGQDKTCQRVQHLLNCVKPSVPTKCGTHDADPFNVIYAMHRVFMNGFDPNCQLVFPSNNSESNMTSSGESGQPEENDCSVEDRVEVSKCYQPLLNSWQPLSIVSDPEQLTELCLITNNLATCSNHSLRCATDTMKAVAAVFKDVCANLKTSLPQGLVCLHESIRYVELCTQEFNTLFGKEGTVSIFLPLSNSAYCDSISNMLSCAQENVTKNCGPVFFTVLTNLHNTFLGSLSGDCGVRFVDFGTLCSGDEYLHQEQCDDVLENKFKDLIERQPDISSLSLRDFAFICTALQDYSACAAENSCSNSLSEMAASIHTRTCGGDLSTLQLIVSCIGDLRGIPEAETCNSLLPGDISLDQLARGDFGNTPITIFACEHLPEYLVCLKPSVLKTCHGSVWPLIQDTYRFFTRSLNLPCGGKDESCKEEQLELVTVCFNKFKGIQSRNVDDFNLDMTCNHFDDFELCLEEIPCQSQLGSGVRNFFRFLCKEQKQQFLEFNQCIGKVSLSDVWEPSCQSEEGDSILGILTSIAQFTEADKICGKANNFLRCAGVGIRDNCGADSVRFITKFHQRYVAGAASEPCEIISIVPLESELDSATTASLIVFATEPSSPFLPEDSCNYSENSVLASLSARFSGTISSYCSEFFSEITEISDFSDNCQFKLFLGLENLQKFVCQTAKPSFEQAHKCLIPALMQNDVKKCEPYFPSWRIEEISPFLQCSKAQQMIQCAVPEIYKYCNQVAANFYYSLHTVFWSGFNGNCLLYYPKGAGGEPENMATETSHDTISPHSATRSGIMDSSTVSSLLEITQGQSISSSNECTEAESNSTQLCARELLGLWDPLTVFDHVEKLRLFCTTYESSDGCTKRKFGCGSNLAEGIIVTAFHICSEVRLQLESSIPCLEDAFFTLESKRCVDNFILSSGDIGSTDLSSLGQGYCNAMSTLISCAKPAIDEACPHGFWELLVGIQGRIYHGIDPDACAIAILSSKGVCTNSQARTLDSCGTTARTLIKDLNQKASDFEGFQEEELRDLCTALRDHDTCSTNIPCSTPVSAVYESLFLKACTEDGHLETVDHVVNCLVKLENDPRAEDCGRILPTDFNINRFLQGDFKNAEITKEFICYTFDPFVRCSKPLAISNCGKDIWNILNGAYELFLQFLDIQCQPQILPTRRTTDIAPLAPLLSSASPTQAPTSVLSTQVSLFSGACHRARQEALIHSIVAKPQCQMNGNYHPLQCNITSGNCWCVDEETGTQIEGTLVAPGQKLPTCGVKEIFSCERIEWKDSCNPTGSKPQPVFRWYRDGNKCRAYRFPYCSLEAHVPPYPFKHRKDCERICLNRRLDAPLEEDE